MRFNGVLKRIFFPEVCPFCEEIIPINKKECGCLEDSFLIDNDFCRHCGSSYFNCSCGSEATAYLKHVCGVYEYSGSVRRALHSFKFREKTNYAPFLGEKMSLRAAECFPEADFSFVCCVPLHESSKRERGYNQSELLARQVAKRLFLPFCDCLIKTKVTKAQHTLSALERQFNPQGSFSVASDFDVKDKTVLLCDDIKTTGSTLRECAEVLKNAGARDVYCLCCAVTTYNASESSYCP